jgi:signal transduction histidine kinase
VVGTARRWWPDVVGGLVAAWLGVLGVVLGPPWATGPVLPQVLLAGGAGLALVAVRRWPWPVLTGEGVLLVVTDTAAPFTTDTPQWSVAVAVGFVAYRAGWPGTVVALVFAYAATLVNVVDTHDLQTIAGGRGALRLVGVAVVLAAPIAFGRWLRATREAEVVARERVREAEERREIETRAARLAERTALARDLHDILAHHVGAIALQAGAAHFAVRRTGRAEDAVDALAGVRRVATQVLDELRDLVDVLRDPDALDAGGADTAGPAVPEPERMIADAVDRVRAAGLSVDADVTGAVADAPLVARTTAARVVQEGLTNALKHGGPGTTAQVRVGLGEDALHVLVSDTGRGDHRATALPGSGHGLAGMRERVALLGGTLTAGPAGDRGWRLCARLPVRVAPPAAS